MGWEIDGLEIEASLGGTQHRVLSYLKEFPGKNRSQLKEDLNLDGSYLTKIIKKLCIKSLVQDKDGCLFPT